jgi:predicted acyl esterase
MRRTALLALLIAVACLPGTALGAEVPPDATHEELYIPSESPVPSDESPELHVDVLRPKGVTGKVPLVLTVSPYTNHATQNATDFDPSKSGPSDRFFDFVVRDAKLFQRGYAYAMVDLRGTGGSQGCNDWGGPGEQNDVKRAVEFLAKQPWSNGRVALYGKSYDGWTGLMGLAQRPAGLAAVVAQEPVVDGYRYLYMNRVRFPNAATTPALFQVIDAAPGTASDSPQYQGNNVYANAVKPGCYPRNIADQQNNDAASAYWAPRNLVERVKGVTVPTFFMQGFIESNTKPDAVFSFFNNLAGTENRAWFGQWDHVRGNDKVGEKFATGRATFVDEVMRFLDQHLKGIAPPVADPKITVQANDGRFRSEQAWPPSDSLAFRSALKGGLYEDDGANNGDGSGTTGAGVWTISQPLPYRAHLAGTPRLRFTVSAQPLSNLVANVYDIGPDRKAHLISRGTTLLDGDGSGELELYGQDWILEPGHRVGVLLSGANAEWWDHVPTNQPVSVDAASIDLPFLTFARTNDLAGEAGPAPSGLRSISVNRSRAFEVPAQTISQAAAVMTLPPPLAAPPSSALASGAPAVATPGGQPASPRKQARARRASRLTVRAKRLKRRGKRRRIAVFGTAPRGSVVTVRVQRGKRRVTRVKRRARRGSYRAVVRLRRPGRYRIRVSAKLGRTVTRARPLVRRVR